MKIFSQNAVYTEKSVSSNYEYTSSVVTKNSDQLLVATETTRYNFITDLEVPRLGLMLVGWGGNNGSTLTASVLANRRSLSWATRNGKQSANYLGSLVMSSTIKLGIDKSDCTKEVFVPLRDLVPMVHPNDLIIGGWDINNANLYDAMNRACVLEPDLRRQIADDMKKMIPLPSIYYPEFIAKNQSERANNLIDGNDKQKHLNKIRENIRDFKKLYGAKVIVLWTANTECFSQVIPKVNDTADSLLKAIASSHPQIAPSTIFAVASILEKCPFINGSPQNTLVPGAIELAEIHNVHVGGDDFKSGQTKIKSVIADFLVGAGIKPLAITSYNHLGNNDGLNLSEDAQFRSKEISKSSVVDDMVASNRILFPQITDKPDHTVVIKYVPSVGDTKRALDEYESEIFMGGRNTMTITTVCEDSLLASPLIIDLVVLCELFTRVKFTTSKEPQVRTLHPVLSPLAYMLKAPISPKGMPVINSLGRQRSAIEAILRALIGLPVNNEACLEWRSN